MPLGDDKEHLEHREEQENEGLSEADYAPHAILFLCLSLFILLYFSLFLFIFLPLSGGFYGVLLILLLYLSFSTEHVSHLLFSHDIVQG